MTHSRHRGPLTVRVASLLALATVVASACSSNVDAAGPSTRSNPVAVAVEDDVDKTSDPGPFGPEPEDLVDLELTTTSTPNSQDGSTDVEATLVGLDTDFVDFLALLVSPSEGVNLVPVPQECELAPRDWAAYVETPEGTIVCHFGARSASPNSGPDTESAIANLTFLPPADGGEVALEVISRYNNRKTDPVPDNNFVTLEFAAEPSGLLHE